MKKAMKRTVCFVLCAVLLLGLLAGCGGKSGAKKVGIIQLVEHPSLDEICAAVTSGLEKGAAAAGMELAIDVQNAQGDKTLINSICEKFVGDGVDLIIAIATPAAQGAAAATADIPIIFSAVTDPVGAKLVQSMDAPGGNCSGTSDSIPVQRIFELAAELTPNVKNFGLLYCTSEDNSASVISEVKAYLDENGCTYEEATVTNVSEVQQATEALLDQCEGIFVPIDNTVASAMSVVADLAKQAKKPVYVAADSLVHDGGLASAGVNYTQLGAQTAEMALQVLQGADVSAMPVQLLTDVNVVVNPETAEAVGVDVSAYLAD